MNRASQPLQGASRPWRLTLVMSFVVVLHVAGVWWWMASQVGSGQGTWSSEHGGAFRVRSTVLQESLPSTTTDYETPRHSVDVAPHQTVQADLPLPPAPSLAAAAPAPITGADPVWVSPIPSDYLSDEQVDVFPRPKDEWVLDWTQVPLSHAPWRVTVRMWVSAAGFVDHVETLDAQPSAEWVSKFLAPLARTEMEPATLAGQPVPVTYVVQLAPDQLQ